MFRKKNKQQQQQIAKELDRRLEPHNGDTEHRNSNTLTLEEIKHALPPEMLLRLTQQMEESEREQSKITLIGDKLFPLDDRTLNYSTELGDKKEVEHMNKLTMWGEMARLHFIPKNMPKEYKERIEHIISKIDTMVTVHKLNKTSYKRRRSLELVHAVKLDAGVVTTEKQVKGAFPK